MPFGTEIVFPPTELRHSLEYWELPPDTPLNRQLEEFDYDSTQDLIFKNYAKLAKKWSEGIRGCESLRYVEIRGQCKQPLLDGIATCPNISHLWVDQGRELDYKVLKTLKLLKIAYLRGTLNSEFSHQCLFDPVVVHLHFSNLPVNLTDLDENHWQRVKCISFMGSGDYSKITIRGIENLSKLKSLENITFAGVRRDTPHRLDMLQDLPNLKAVNIFGLKKSWSVEDGKRLLEKGVLVNDV